MPDALDQMFDGLVAFAILCRLEHTLSRRTKEIHPIRLAGIM